MAVSPARWVVSSCRECGEERNDYELDDWFYLMVRVDD